MELVRRVAVVKGERETSFHTRRPRLRNPQGQGRQPEGSRRIDRESSVRQKLFALLLTRDVIQSQPDNIFRAIVIKVCGLSEASREVAATEVDSTIISQLVLEGGTGVLGFSEPSTSHQYSLLGQHQASPQHKYINNQSYKGAGKRKPEDLRSSLPQPAFKDA